MLSQLQHFALPIIFSALALGIYDILKKHSVAGNSVMPVLFWATFSGLLFFCAGLAISGRYALVMMPGQKTLWLILLKSVIVTISWVCVYYAMRDLPLSLAAPIRASAPLWTLAGSLFIFGEIPTLLQGTGMAAVFAGFILFSSLGHSEGFKWHSKAMMLIIAGTLAGAASALYDKFLLNTLAIAKEAVQFYFSLYLTLILGAAMLVRKYFFCRGTAFVWKWSIPLTGIMLIVADCLYFYALSMPDTRISILSFLRRSSAVIPFLYGIVFFREKNLCRKLVALILILTGAAILAFAPSLT